MATEDEARRELFDLLESRIGTRGAALLMTYLPPTGWTELATKRDLDALRAELRGEIQAVVPKLWAANAATMLGISGLVFAVASFAR